MRIERAVWAAKLCAAAAVLAALIAAPARADEAGTATATLRNHVRCPMTSAALHRAAEGALLRLEHPECQRIFTDFRDVAGQPLCERLEELGHSGASYLRGRMWFAEASGSAGCQWAHVVAVTKPGSAVVFICARQFRERAVRDPDFAEVALIHEMLHSLGLGENPPSSLEINERIARRCDHR